MSRIPIELKIGKDIFPNLLIYKYLKIEEVQYLIHYVKFKI